MPTGVDPRVGKEDRQVPAESASQLKAIRAPPGMPGTYSMLNFIASRVVGPTDHRKSQRRGRKSWSR